VFVNYRTGDGDWAATFIYTKLSPLFGADQVFLASKSIPPGDHYPSNIEARLASSQVVLALIGEKWLTSPRLKEPGDWVRREIRFAFSRRIPVIPVLLDGVPRLSERDLPDDIAALARCQDRRLHHDDPDDGAINGLADRLRSMFPCGVGEPWRVRIRDRGGAVLGAGVLLANEYVLTCAHVLTGPGDEVNIEFVGTGYSPGVKARPVPEWHIPPSAGHRGDVALLRLGHRLTDRKGTVLRRTALSWDRPVHMCGFSRESGQGAFTHSTLRGSRPPTGEWLELNAGWSGQQRVPAEFGGAGVVDDQTGYLLGIVVGAHADDGNPAWMAPVEVILDHIPRIAEWVTGPPVTDPVTDRVFSRPVSVDPHPGQQARDVNEWLARRGSGDCLLILAGPQAAVLYQVVALSSRSGPATAPDPPARTAPAAGSIDLAVDVSGKTADEFARRILDRAAIPPDGTVTPAEQVRRGVPAMTIVVDGVDVAEQPEDLLERVIRPLAEGGSRLVLGFREPSAPSLARARSWVVGSVGYRLERLAARVDEVDAAERRRASLRGHIQDRASGPDAGARLRAALSVLAAIEEPDTASAQLDRCERQTAGALRATEHDEARLRRAYVERDQLRGCLGAYQAKANAGGLGEDVGVAAYFQKAHGLLWRSPTDLSAARNAMHEYVLAIRRCWPQSKAGRG
jgi:hypothetical protein